MMHRLTTDTPKENFEMALNLFYVKDKEVWVRGYGKGGADISLLNLTREEAEKALAKMEGKKDGTA